MRRVVRIAGLGAGVAVGLVVLLVVVGFFLPSTAPMGTTSATVDASAAELFPYFNSRDGHRRLWGQVAPAQIATGFPPMEIVDLGGPDAGAGTRIGFFPDGSRLGSMRGAVSSLARGEGVIVESERDRRVDYEIDFGFVVAYRTIELESLDAGATRVIWSETLRADNPLMRYMLLAVDESTASNFDAVLAALARLAEAERSRDP